MSAVVPFEKSVGALLKEAQIYIQSGLLPREIRSPQQAVVIMKKGQELGIPAMEALSSIHVIQGKPTVSPQLMLGLARRTGQLEDMKIAYNGESCSVTLKRKGQSPHTESFGSAEASSMGLSRNPNYKTQPMVMYKWRALSAALRVVFPDVTCGMYTHEELSPETRVNEDGEIIDEVKFVQQEHGESVAKMADRGKQQIEEKKAEIQEDPTAIATVNDERTVSAGELRKRITNALMEICDGDIDEAKKLLIDASSFKE